MNIAFIPSKKYTPYMVRFPKIGRRFFKTEKDAKTAIIEFTKGRSAVALGKRELDEVLYCKTLLGVTPLLTAVRFYLEHNTRIDGTATLKTLCDRYWSQVNKPTSSACYTKKVRRFLDRFLDAIGPETPAVTFGFNSYRDYIQSIPSIIQQADNHRVLRSMFKAAVEGSLIAKNPASGWEPAVPPKKAPPFMPVEGADLLLNWVCIHRNYLTPAFALQLFCGIRTAELCRKPDQFKKPLDWSDVDFENRRINIPAAVSKTDERRVIDWTPDCLWDWLKPFRKASGRIVCADYASLKSRAISECRRELQEENLGFSQNAFRHSFATYAVAYFQSAERVALLMGHRGSDMLFQHYRDYTSPESAKDYFSIKPSAYLLLRYLNTDCPSLHEDLTEEVKAA